MQTFSGSGGFSQGRGEDGSSNVWGGDNTSSVNDGENKFSLLGEQCSNGDIDKLNQLIDYEEEDAKSKEKI